jgi:cell division protein FtsW (lipid II flippase)
MKRPHWGMYVLAVAILVVGLVWAGVPSSTLLIGGLLLVCPVMMFVMMRGMQGRESGPDHESAPPASNSHGDGRRDTIYRSTQE